MQFCPDSGTPIGLASGCRYFQCSEFEEIVGQALMACLRAVIDHDLVWRGMILTVAERARLPIIGLRYGLSWYFAR
jgi:hypothetical protein